MEYNPINPEKEFVKRTIEIAKQQEKHKYCTTLQINLLFGTIMLPKSHWYTSLDHTILKNNDIEGVTIEYKNTHITLKVLLHCLRNGIAHWRENNNQNIRFYTKNLNGKNEIVKVTITGSGKVNNIHETVKVDFDVKQDGIIHFMEKVYSYLT